MINSGGVCGEDLFVAETEKKKGKVQEWVNKMKCTTGHKHGPTYPVQPN
jgi:hypothetical protein